MSRFLGCAAAAVVVQLISGAARAGIITFEELGTRPDVFVDTDPLRNEIGGVGFQGMSGDLDGGAILNVASGFGFEARSGEQFLAFNRIPEVVLKNGGHPIDPERVTFAGAVSAVEIYAATGVNEDGSPGDGKYQLRAFDAVGTLLAEDVQAIKSDWGRLAVSSDKPIAYVTLTELSGFVGFAYDDLSYTPVPGPGVAALGVAGMMLSVRRGRR